METRKKFTSIDKGVEFVEEKLKAYRVKAPYNKIASLNAEHAICHITDAFHGHDTEYTVIINKTPFSIEISIEGCGHRIELLDVEPVCKDCESAASKFTGRTHEAFSYKRKDGVNRISFVVTSSNLHELSITIGAMILGILVGTILRIACPESICEALNYYVFELFSTLFMNALKIIVGPVVFFSLACCVSRFKNLTDLGRIGIKTFVLYLFTTIVSISIGFCLYKAMPVGDPSIASYIAAADSDEEAMEELNEIEESYSTADFSIRNLLANIVPSGFFEPFLAVNLLQIIFLGILVGIGISKCGSDTAFLTNLVEALNHLLMSLTSIITKFIPVAVFCAMATLIISMGLEALKSIISFAILVVLGMVCMVIFYCLFMWITTRLNPFIFLRKFSNAMMTAFATSSATATMPTSIKCCEDMGMNSQIVSFTIPLGANINMDGSSMVFILAVMFMSKIYGIDLTGSLMISTVVSIIFLALGSPSVAGADLVIIAVLLDMVGVPMSAIGLILGVDAIFDMIQAVSNTTGDAVVSLIVSKSERMLDVEKYNS